MVSGAQHSVKVAAISVEAVVAAAHKQATG